MQEEIINSLHTPQKLEQLYQENKIAFKKAFNTLYPQIRDHLIAQFWYIRLNFEAKEAPSRFSKEWLWIAVASLVGGCIAKLSDFFSIPRANFYAHYFAFIVFVPLIIYFSWKRKISMKKLLITFSVILLSAIYMQMLPQGLDKDTIVLACIYLPFFLWALLGLVFMDWDAKDYLKRSSFLRFNGDLLVMTTLILIAGGILTGITIFLFRLIDIQVENFISSNVVSFGLPASFVVASYLISKNAQLVNKISPVIARIFTPLVFITLLAYLIAIIFSGKYPYNDRGFLLVFNLVLIGVMAIIFFSASAIQADFSFRVTSILLFGLTIVSIVLCVIALSAIVFRTINWGITPNRLAVFGSDFFILINLLITTYQFARSWKNPDQIEHVMNSIAFFLPFYIGWAMLVCFTFPLIFRFQ
ncbi:MAG: hypothetical protein K6T34_06285 [Thermoflavifilum sp.]|nr:hypothetical protein [Thermoflavifilum sp.]